MNKRFLVILYICIIVVACHNNNSKKDAGQKTSTPASVRNDSNIQKKTILFFGNSLTAGYGLDPAESFPSLIQEKLDSLHLPFKVINAGVSGETTSGGVGRIDWILQQPVDIFVLELGANDGLRGIPLNVTQKNLQTIIDKVKSKYSSAKIVLAGMQIPPNMGPEYTTKFKKIYPELASLNNIKLIPFLLDGVGGNPELNQQDGIHPNETGEKIVAENVWKVLRELCKP